MAKAVPQTIMGVVTDINATTVTVSVFDENNMPASVRYPLAAWNKLTGGKIGLMSRVAITGEDKKGVTSIRLA